MWQGIWKEYGLEHHADLLCSQRNLRIFAKFQCLHLLNETNNSFYKMSIKQKYYKCEKCPVYNRHSINANYFCWHLSRIMKSENHF